MRPALSSTLAGFGTTIFSEMTRLANEHGAINLAQGFPDFDGPEFVKEAAIAAIRGGQGQYERVSGIPEMHRALAAKCRRDRGLDYAPDTEIVVTTGATEAIFAAIRGLCDAGDEVVLFEPYYDSYKASVRMAGAVPRVVTLRTPDWSFDPAALAAAFGPRTRAILVNTPHNPTGKVFSPRRARADRRGSAASAASSASPTRSTSTSVYEGAPRSDGDAARHAGAHDHDLVLRKTFSLTGWKIGWAMAPPELVSAVRSAHQFITFAAATPLQHGAAAALRPASTLRGASPPTTATSATTSCASFARSASASAPAGHVLRLRGLPPVRLRRRPAPSAPPDREDRRRRDPAVASSTTTSSTGSPTCASPSARSGETPGGGRRATGEAVRVALVQMDLAWEDVAENHRRAPPPARGSGRARARASRCCPRCSAPASRWSPTGSRSRQGGPSETFLRETAQELSLSVAREDSGSGAARPRNMAILAGPDGSVARYAKIHPVHVRRRGQASTRAATGSSP